MRAPTSFAHKQATPHGFGIACARACGSLQMPWIFGTARVPVGDGTGPDAMLSHVDTSKHVVVLCRGHFYKVTVLGPDGALLADAASLERRFADIAVDAAAQPAAGCVGALTTAGRSVWSAARARLASASAENAASLAAVDEALFLVCLDAVSVGRVVIDYKQPAHPPFQCLFCFSLGKKRRAHFTLHTHTHHVQQSRKAGFLCHFPRLVCFLLSTFSFSFSFLHLSL